MDPVYAMYSSFLVPISFPWWRSLHSEMKIFLRF